MLRTQPLLRCRSLVRSALATVQPQQQQQRRHLNLLEYQSKHLLQDGGVAIQQFCVLEAEAASRSADSGWAAFAAPEYVVKAQILAGGRGKGHFSNGFQGGVHITKDRSKVLALADHMLGHNLITKQTPPAGCPVHKVMVARSVNIVRETYVCIVMDRSHNGPVLVASPDGGMDIEAVAERTPERLLTVPIDIEAGLGGTQARQIAHFLGFAEPALNQRCTAELLKLWHLFCAVDAVQIEINPLAETDEGKVIAVDAKLQFDDNAQFRQRAIFALDDAAEADPREREAAKYDLNYVAMEGSIGCLVNGAGLAMATMDIIKLHGAEPANFLDVGGNVREEQVLRAFQILVADANVRGILVNVFGGIVNCATIANGVVAACRQMELRVPLVVRLEGTNVAEARRILAESGLRIEAAGDLDDAAQKIVAATK